MRGIGHSISDHHVVLCKVRLVGAWIKRREVVVGARKIRSDKLRNINAEKDILGLLSRREYNLMEIILLSICGSR